jgi:DHA2 family methylenomycin A resistance protein-like MFS transporter
MFDAPAARARAAVIWVAAGSLSVTAGPLVGGFLIDAFGWRSIFVINLPFGVISAVLAWRTVPSTPVVRVRLDRTGQVTAAAALGPIAMVPPSFLREKVPAVPVLSAGLMGFAFYGTLLAMSLYFQQARGYSPGAAGVALLPLTAGSAIGPLFLYRRLSRRFGHAVMLLAGFACALSGTVLLGWTGTSAAYPVAFAGLLLVGGASTISFSALTSLLMAHVPTAQSGLAAGPQNTTRQTGALITVSVDAS